MEEILRVQKALYNTSSLKLKKDYSKYLKKLERELKEYDGTIYIQCDNKKKFGKIVPKNTL